ncbi:MAG TPA: hypothetical protein VJ724_09485 [Tahibacter sp.]|nr:hypothetical protein [Tahibacter sp.]
MTAYEIVKYAHASIGVLALATFWIAAFARKGSPLHVGVGRVYLVTMAAIVATALPLVAVRIANGQFVTGTFFVLLLSLVATACFVAWTAIRRKRDRAAFLGRGYRALMASNVVAGAAAVVLGAMYSRWIFVAFGVFGVKLGWDMWKTLREENPAPNWWFVQHYQAMIGNGIATHIAFALIGLPRVFPNVSGGVLTYLGWLGPLAIGLTTQYLLDRKYVKKPVVAKRPAAATA